MNLNELLSGLPGETLIRQGLTDFLGGQTTVPACLIGIAQTRFRRAGLLGESADSKLTDPELILYALLRREGGDAYARYNALLGELVSFEQALDHRLSRLHRQQPFTE